MKHTPTPLYFLAFFSFPQICTPGRSSTMPHQKNICMFTKTYTHTHTILDKMKPGRHNSYLLVLCYHFEFMMDVSRRRKSQTTKFQGFDKGRNALVQKSPYRWKWMRKSSHTRKEWPLLILSWICDFGMTMSTLRRIPVAWELIPIGSSLKRNKL